MAQIFSDVDIKQRVVLIIGGHQGRHQFTQLAARAHLTCLDPLGEFQITFDYRAHELVEKLLFRRYVVVQGGAINIEFVRDRKTKERFPANPGFGVRVGRRALRNGLLCRFDPHWLAFGPPLISTTEQIEEMVAILDRSLGEVLAENDQKNLVGNGFVS